MTTHVFLPQDSTVKSIIEFYVLAESPGYQEVQTIPNGRVDASIVFEGELEWYFENRKAFERLAPATFYPLTRTVGKARCTAPMRCIGVKFYPHVLILPPFQNKKLTKPLSFSEFFKSASHIKKLIADLRSTDDLEKMAHILDVYFQKCFFSAAHVDPWVRDVTQAIESESSANLKIKEIAEKLGMSIKTLERRFQKTIGLTPKSFTAIIQLHQTARNIRKKSPVISHGDLTEALGNGYYDQSHFVKSCQRITGLTPKKLFTSLSKQMTDLLIV